MLIYRSVPLAFSPLEEYRFQPHPVASGYHPENFPGTGEPGMSAPFGSSYRPSPRGSLKGTNSGYLDCLIVVYPRLEGVLTQFKRLTFLENLLIFLLAWQDGFFRI